jgi:glucan biosynthesis protein C
VIYDNLAFLGIILYICSGFSNIQLKKERKMTEQASAKPRTRLFHLDNLRIYLTILVILHHDALAYGGAGSWGVIDPGVDEISPIIFTIFNAVNQSYFMSAFFLLAGYFTPRSLEKKGAKVFLIDRLIRLGVPLLVYTTLIININEFILSRYAYGVPFHGQFGYNAGHLWFLQALLIFALIYVVYKAIAGRNGENSPFQIYRDRFPPDVVLFLSIVVLGVVTYAVRLVFPVGVWFLEVQPGHFAHYIFCFYVGILAYRGDWFGRLSRAQARRWGLAAIFIFLLFFVISILGGVLEGDENLAKFMGGPHWQAFAYSMWESAMLVAVVVFLLYFFRERLSKAGPLARSMAANVYTVYIIHQTILFLLHSLALTIDIPTVLKFVIVGLIAVPLCFVLSTLIRRIPYARRVLG